MPATLNLAGQKFGRLTAVGDLGARKLGKPHIWICNCDCGDIVSVENTSLTRGLTQSCGCLYRETRHQLRLTRTSKTEFRAKNGHLRSCPGAFRLKESRYQEQNGLCGVCHLPLDVDFRKSYWDHNHATQESRDLVHPRCNTLLGFLELNPDLLTQALDYLDYYRGWKSWPN
jgi:recombination endonuclease VII